jgi:hypothetical protein
MTRVSQSTTKGVDPKGTDDLSRDLHQAAQPLTVLQGCLELVLSRPHTVDEYKRSIQRALDESRRVSACFERIRESVRMSQAAETAVISDNKKAGCAHV